jgi:hypothetical protein
MFSLFILSSMALVLAFEADKKSITVSRLDDGAQQEGIALPGTIGAGADVNNCFAVVLLSSPKSIAVVDLMNNRVTQEVAIPDKDEPCAITLSDDGTKVAFATEKGSEALFLSIDHQASCSFTMSTQRARLGQLLRPSKRTIVNSTPLLLTKTRQLLRLRATQTMMTVFASCGMSRPV